MKTVNKRLSEMVGTKTVLNICPETGIQTKTEVPGVGKWVFTQVHPFADYDNCLDYIREVGKSGKQISQLPANILAGIFITILREKNLLVEWQNVQQANFLLSDVSPISLASAILYYRRIAFNRNELPKFAFDGSQSADSLILSHIKICNREDADLFNRKDFVTLNEEKNTKLRVKILSENKKIQDWKNRANQLKPTLIQKFPSKQRSIEKWVYTIKASAGALSPIKAKEISGAIRFSFQDSEGKVNILAESFAVIFDEMAKENVLRDDDFLGVSGEMEQSGQTQIKQLSAAEILRKRLAGEM